MPKAGRQQREIRVAALDELDGGHLGVVPLPDVRDVLDSGVTAATLAVTFGARLEQGMYQLLVVDVTQRLPGHGETRGKCVCMC